MKWVAAFIRQTSHGCTLMPLLASPQCDSLRSYSRLQGVNKQSFTVFAVFSCTLINKNVSRKLILTLSVTEKKLLNLTQSKQWLDASLGDWNFRTKTQHPFSKIYVVFQYCFFLKDLEIGNLEARIVNRMVCGCESM